MLPHEASQKKCAQLDGRYPKVSPSTGSELNHKIAASIEAWRNRPIDGEFTYVYLDGIWLKRSWGGDAEGPCERRGGDAEGDPHPGGSARRPGQGRPGCRETASDEARLGGRHRSRRDRRDAAEKRALRVLARSPDSESVAWSLPSRRRGHF
jgi:hypothetical protein